MSITVRGPDGSVHTFPEGTDEAVIRRAMARHYGNAPEQRRATASAARQTAERTGRRNAFERFWDDAKDGWKTSWIAESWRAGELEGAQSVQTNERDIQLRRSGQITGAEHQRRIRAGQAELERRDVPFLGNPVRSLGRAKGALMQGLFGAEGGVEHFEGVIADERTRRQEFAALNDADQGGDSFLRYQREGDYVGLAAHGAAALGGTLAAAALDPVSYIGMGRTLIVKAATQASLAGAFDFIAQDAAIDAGVQDKFDTGRLALSAAAGGAFQAFGDGLGKSSKWFRDRFFGQPEAPHVGDLDAADDLARPALSETEVDKVPALIEPPARVVEAEAPEPVTPKAPEVDPEAPKPSQLVPAEEPAARRAGDPVDPVPATVVAPEGGPKASAGDGAAGWDDVDWGKRRSPERVQAALKHLESLQKWIKPDAVEAFVRRMDEGIEGAAEGVFLNARWVDWDAFKESPENLIGLHNVLADVFGDLYRAAGVKKQGWSETRKIAKQMGVTMSDVIKTHADVTGEGGLTVKMYAMRDAFNASVDDAAAQMRTTLADLRSGKLDADAVRNVAALVQRSAILGAADASVSGEIARALQSRKMLSQPRHVLNDLQSAFDTLNDSLNSADGLQNPADVEKVIDDLLKGYDKKGAAGFNSRLRKMRAMGVMDYIGYAAVANLLSGIPTHVRNAVGTPTHAVLNLASKFVAAGVVRPIRQGALKLAGVESRSVTVRDTVAYVEGTYEALGEAMRLGFKAFVKGAPVADNVSGLITDTAHIPFAYSNARLQKWVQNGPSLATIGDVLGVAYFEVARTFGFRPSVAMDEFNKALARRAELRSLALREASYEAGKRGTGAEAKRVFEATQKAILEEPTSEALAAAKALFGPGGEDVNASFSPDSPEFQMQAILKGIDVRQAAVDHAQLLAYQQSGAVVESLEKFLRKVPIVKHFAANFVRTPTQLFVAAFRDYNPVTAPIVLAFEAIGEGGRARHKAFFDALRGEEDAIAGGGAAAEMVIARQIVGAGILGVVWSYWADGGIVGAQVPEGDEYAGVLPYSIRLPNGEWVQFTGFSPLAEHLGLVADVGQIMRDKETTDDQDFSLIGALGVAIRGNVFNKSFLKGVSDFMDLISGGDYATDDPNNTAAGMARGAASLLLGRAIPLSSFMKRLSESQDHVTRDARTWIEQATAYLPNQRESLALKRDFMGRPIIRKPGERGVFQVAKTSRASGDPLEIELHNLAARPVSALDIRPTPSSLDGIKLDAHEHNRLQEIQGQLYRDRRSGRNMEEELRHLITTDGYQTAAPEYRETLIKKVITEYRRAGKKAALNPNSPLYMRELAARTGPERIRRAASANGWDFDETFRRRGRAFGLTDDDRQLAEALAAVD